MVVLFTVLGIAAVVGIDQLLKLAALQYLQPVGQTKEFLGVVRLHYTENTGASFSMFSQSTTLLSVVTAIMLLVCLYLLLARKLQKPFLHWCLAAITAGGLGNLVDRIIRGFVVDYVEVVFVQFAIFNFADCFITAGTVFLLGYLIYDMYREQKQKKNGQEEKRHG